MNSEVDKSGANKCSTPGTCPKCGTKLEPYAEVDIGVGVMTGGPWGCPACHWVEPEEPLPELAPQCEASMGRAQCSEPAGHTGPHLFEEDFV